MTAVAQRRMVRRLLSGWTLVRLTFDGSSVDEHVLVGFVYKNGLERQRRVSDRRAKIILTAARHRWGWS
jgi:hypothetical protein